MVFRRRAQELVNLAEKAQEELTQKEETLSGIIAIGCGEMRGVQEVAKLITGFQERYPLVKFELYSGNNEDIKERMEQGTLDMGLLLEPVSIVKYDFIRIYNAVIAARERKGAAICVKLDCHYDDMKFLPLEPKLELSSVLAWKDQQSYSKATTAFIKYVKDVYR